MIDQDSSGATHTRKKSAIVDAAAVGMLAAVTLAFFWKIVLTNQVLSGVDLFAYFYPYRDFASEALREGRLPLWNPYLFMGAPLLANSQVAVLYPLHWPFLWLSAPKQIAWSIVLHIWIAGAGTYLFARWVMRRRPLTSLVGAAVFALGGFLGAQVEHINQLNASAWMPWLLICLEGATSKSPGHRRKIAFVFGCAVISLILLAGHTQAAYIVLAAAGCYTLLRGVQHSTGAGWRRAAGWLRGPGLLAGMLLFALLLTAGQLLPTIELSRLSVRSGGLDFRDAVSFSLKPAQVFRAFLPPLAWKPPFSEFVAYVGLSGLALAGFGVVSSIRSLRRRALLQRPQPPAPDTRSFALPALGLTFLGVFLAFGAYNPVYYLLYKLIPGISLFRAPARWLLLYAFGMALLAAVGIDAIANAPLAQRRAGRLAAPLAGLLLLVELFVCGRKLAYNLPTAPAAYDSMRSASAHLLAGNDDSPVRFLSLSDILYDPGDLPDLQSMFATALSQDAIYDLIVATKMKEVLAYNLPLRYRLFSVDGYDGGLLPTSRYVTLERLFLGADDIWPDGRLRQQLKSIPPVRLLSLLNVRYVITDKLQDAWSDGVYYDLEAQVPLGETELTNLPDFEATHLGVVTYLTATVGLPAGTPVAQVVVEAGDTAILSSTLRAGYETAEGLFGPASVVHGRAIVIHNWRDNPSGNDYLAILDLGKVIRPSRIRIRSLLPDSEAPHVMLRGMSLIDSRTETSISISVNPALRLVHSGDVKVYENLAALRRAFVVHGSRTIDGDVGAIALLRDPGFDPSRQVVLTGTSKSEGKSFAYSGTEASEVKLLRYGAERIEIKATLESPGYLVLTDAFYPGWQAEIDGTPAPILCADIYFRAVALDAGEHTVTMQYRPQSVFHGLAIGGAAWVGWVIALAMLALQAGRKHRNLV